MKIEQLLVQHFYNNREVTLQGMGTFTLSADFALPKEDKQAEIPDDAIVFEYNAKATADDALIDYIVQQSRKMRALAAADLDSYLVLGKQFLNIGKPFKIEGVGMLIKNQQGELNFIKGHSFNTKPDNAPAAAVTEKTINPEISFASDTRKAEGSSKKGLMVAGVIIGVLLLGATGWYFFGRKNDTAVDNKNLAVSTDTLVNSKPKTDTVAAAGTIPAAPANDGYTFKVVFLQTPDSAAAVSRMNVLIARKHKIVMFTKDSVYNLAEPFTLPLSDTAHIKDSLNRYYYSGKAFIQLK